MKPTAKTNSHVRALLNLIQDDDLKVSSLAMEEFLKLGDEVADRLIAEHQEAADPRLRHRIHQLSSIYRRRQSRVAFVSGVHSQKMGIWEGLCHINGLYDLQCRFDGVMQSPSKLIDKLKQRRFPGLPQIAALMRDQHFSVPEVEVVDIELYLVESVMESRLGSSIILSALVHHAATAAGWHGAVVLFEGRFCLVDHFNRVLDPAAGWVIRQQENGGLLHPCAPRDIWLAVLTQLFLVSLVEGHLRDIFHFGSLLTSLNGNDTSVLPSPLGRA